MANSAGSCGRETSRCWSPQRESQRAALRSTPLPRREFLGADFERFELDAVELRREVAQRGVAVAAHAAMMSATRRRSARRRRAPAA